LFVAPRRAREAVWGTAASRGATSTGSTCPTPAMSWAATVARRTVQASGNRPYTCRANLHGDDGEARTCAPASGIACGRRRPRWPARLALRVYGRWCARRHRRASLAAL